MAGAVQCGGNMIRYGGRHRGTLAPGSAGTDPIKLTACTGYLTMRAPGFVSNGFSGSSIMG